GRLFSRAVPGLKERGRRFVRHEVVRPVLGVITEWAAPALFGREEHTLPVQVAGVSPSAAGKWVNGLGSLPPVQPFNLFWCEGSLDNRHRCYPTHGRTPPAGVTPGVIPPDPFDLGKVRGPPAGTTGCRAGPAGGPNFAAPAFSS